MCITTTMKKMYIIPVDDDPLNNHRINGVRGFLLLSYYLLTPWCPMNPKSQQVVSLELSHAHTYTRYQKSKAQGNSASNLKVRKCTTGAKGHHTYPRFMFGHIQKHSSRVKRSGSRILKVICTFKGLEDIILRHSREMNREWRWRWRLSKETESSSINTISISKYMA